MMKLIKKRKITSRLLIYILFLPLILASCQKNGSKSNKALASVDGRVIETDLYTKELKFYQSYYSKVFGENYLVSKSKNGSTNDEVLREELLDSMIKDQIMLIDLSKHNINLNDNNSNKLKKDLLDSMSGDDSLKSNIDSLGVNENIFNEILYNDSIRKSHYEMFLAKDRTKDSEILEYYKKHKNLQKMYKYNVLVFDDENSAKEVKEKIKDSSTFRQYLDKDIRNYSVINSEFVYADDEILNLAKIKDKNIPSKIFKYQDKYMIAMINSYNENENELLLRAKEIYQKEQYDNYLKKLIKSSKIKVFV